ncbi:MAG: hypothetical protein DRQ88_13170 [Epsilonproteobacteria bacterium]|nr:MAG: hypothetical protein DRQ88_13170 [Campylobacterota bacterium]
MHIYKKFTRDVLLVGISRVLVALRGIILIPVLAKTLGAADYGLWSQSMVTIYLLTPLAGLGLSQGMIRFLAVEKNKEKIGEDFYTILSITLVAAIAVAVALYTSSSSLAELFFSNENATQILQISSAILVFWVLDALLLAYFKTFRQMGAFAFASTGVFMVEILFIAAVTLLGWGLVGAVTILLLSRIIFFLILLAVIYTQIGFTLPRFINTKKYLRFSLPFIPSAVFAWVMSAADKYLIGFYMSSADVGIYSVSYNIGNILSALMFPLYFVLSPALSKMWDENKIAEIENHLKYSQKYYLMIAIPSLFGLTILSKQILRILTKPEFIPDGQIIIPIIALSMLIYSSLCSLHIWIFALIKKTEKTTLLYLFGGIINITANILLIPPLGLLGAAIATLISFTAVGILTLAQTKNYITYSIDNTFIIKTLIASTTMILLITIINPTNVITTTISIIMGATTYFTVLIILNAFEEKEKQFFHTVIMK